MTISSAIAILGIEDIFEESADTIKSKYRTLIKQYHPDSVTGDEAKSRDVLDAYNLIKQELPKIQQYKNTTNSQLINIGLPFDKLLELYNGKTVSFHELTLDKANVYRYNTIILLSATITHNDIQKVASSIAEINMNREYEIWTDIQVDDINNEENVKIEVVDKSYTMNIKGQLTRIPVKFDTTKVTVIIEKKLRA